MNILNVINFNHKVIGSNWAYPNLFNYKVVEIDSKSVDELLTKKFGVSGLRITNKYVVKVDTKLLYQHDHKTYLLS